MRNKKRTAIASGSKWLLIEQGINPERRCYTVDELTQILGVGRKAVYSLIRKKAFPAIRISSIGYRIPKDSFNAWMLRQ